MSYRSESRFSNALCDELTRRGVFHQRIESAETGCGIHDLLLVGPVRDMWVELKNIAAKPDGLVTVPWRKGQQAWALQYRRASGRCTYTLVAAGDGFMLIQMTRRFKGNVVGTGDYVVYMSLHDAIDALVKMIF